MRSVANVSFALAAGLVAGCVGGGPDESVFVSRLDGAIFTTLADGTRVNANIYMSKDDVYLDGGPGGGSPTMAAALPAGDYYFQVTDPSGKTLLSSDAIECRRFRVDGDGLITMVVEGPDDCEHMTATDTTDGGLTVQLMPYADTPNPGGEYKAWITPVENYDADAGVHGFIHRYSKTDNFKVRAPDVAPPEEPKPCCGDGHVDDGEECDDGNTTDGDGCSATCMLEPPPKEPCCGDGHVDDGEECDDGNTTSGDGCSATCMLEPPAKEPCCGDGHVDAGEECDDGNTTGGDGCSATCMTEPVQTAD